MRCEMCGKEFVPKVHNQTCCSKECSDANRHRAKPTKGNVTCIRCGKVMHAVNLGRRFCTECSHQKRLEEGRARYRTLTGMEEALPIRVCVICGKEFKPVIAVQICCSEECSKKRKSQMAMARQRARAKGEPPGQSSKCRRCGKEYWRTGTQIYCPDCRKLLNYSKYKKLHPKPKPKPAKPLDAWIKEARECNLDYGTYRTLIQIGKTFEELKSTASLRPLPLISHPTWLADESLAGTRKFR